MCSIRGWVVHYVRRPARIDVEGRDLTAVVHGDVQVCDQVGRDLVEPLLHGGPPIRQFLVVGANYPGFLIQPDHPEQPIFTGCVRMSAQPPGCFLGLRPLALQLHAAVFDTLVRCDSRGDPKCPLFDGSVAQSISHDVLGQAGLEPSLSEVATTENSARAASKSSTISAAITSGAGRLSVSSNDSSRSQKISSEALSRAMSSS